MSDVVSIQVPNTAAYAGVLRYLAATMAAQAHFDVDRVEDARLAVDEALNFLLPHATGPVTCTIGIEDSAMTAHLVSLTDVAEIPSTNTFGWIVMQSMAQKLESALLGQHLHITLRLDQPANLHV